MSIMKFAVCSISSTASRSPPSEIRGTLAVAALPMGFARRSCILFVSLTAESRGVNFVNGNTSQFAPFTGRDRQCRKSGQLGQSRCPRKAKRCRLGGASWKIMLEIGFDRHEATRLSGIHWLRVAYCNIRSSVARPDPECFRDGYRREVNRPWSGYGFRSRGQSGTASVPSPAVRTRPLPERCH